MSTKKFFRVNRAHLYPLTEGSRNEGAFYGVLDEDSVQEIPEEEAMRLLGMGSLPSASVLMVARLKGASLGV